MCGGGGGREIGTGVRLYGSLDRLLSLGFLCTLKGRSDDNLLPTHLEITLFLNNGP